MFDPYRKWLGISPKDQPPHHYRLLAIDLFESDPEVIDAAANRQMSYVQQRATGEHLADSQRLLNELSAARLCLLDPKKRSAYDATLRAQLGPRSEAAAASPPAVAPADPLAFLESAAPPLSARTVEQPAAPPPPLAFLESAAPPIPRRGIEPSVIVPPLPPARPATYRRRSRVSRQFPMLVLVAGGCLAAAVAGIVFMTSHDVQKPLASVDKRAAEVPKAGKKGADAPSPRANPPQTPKPAIYNVEIDPPFATLVVRNDRGTTSGTGKQRQIRIADPSQPALVAASCDGYQTAQQWLDPKPGQNENLRIVLEKLPPPQEKPSPPQAKPNPPQEKPSPPPPEPPTPAQPENPPSPQGGNLLAGAVFATTIDAHGLMRIAGFKGTGYAGAYVGGGHNAVLVDGKVGKALRFGNGGLVTIRGKFPSGQQPRTLSVWLRAAEGKQDQAHALVCGDPHKDSQVFSIQIIGGNWFFSPHGGLGPVDTHVAVDTSWHHHCLVYDGKLLTYAIDAAPANPVPLQLNTSSGGMCLGGLFANPPPFNGDMGELIVYDRPLTAAEIKQLHQMGEDGISVVAPALRPMPPAR